MTEERLLTTAQVSERLAIPTSTLRRWRSDGDGPPWVRVNKRQVRYRLADLSAWVDALQGGGGEE